MARKPGEEKGRKANRVTPKDNREQGTAGKITFTDCDKGELRGRRDKKGTEWIPSYYDVTEDDKSV